MRGSGGGGEKLIQNAKNIALGGYAKDYNKKVKYDGGKANSGFLEAS